MSFQYFSELENTGYKADYSYPSDWNVIHYKKGDVVLQIHGNCETIIQVAPVYKILICKTRSNSRILKKNN